MRSLSIKFLTFSATLFFLSQTSAGNIFTSHKSKTHLRWKFASSKDQLHVKKSGKIFELKMLDRNLYQSLKSEIKKTENKGDYIENVVFLGSNSNNVFTIKVGLKGENTEIFSFYKNRDNLLIVDFWSDKDEIDTNLSAVKSTTKKEKRVRENPEKKKSITSQDVNFINQAPKKQNISKKKQKEVQKQIKKVTQTEKKGPYRDFRYGASLTWDYPALSPKIEKFLDVGRKTAAHFYPIEDRNFDEGEREAHLQLCINLYRKSKWGLMYKSIKLFQKKYGQDQNSIFLEYLKANALLKNNLKKGETEPVKSAIAMYERLSEKTDEYKLKRALLKYLISYNLEENNHVSALKNSKRLYVSSQENYDYEESAKAAESILFTLSKLGQIEKINELVSEKTIKKIVSGQVILAYKFFTLLSKGQVQDVISLYENKKKSLAKPIHEAILYNVAESYFRNAQYEKAIKRFDEFVSNYSYHPYSSRGRLRLALSYDILGRKNDVVSELYKHAIDRTTPGPVAYEARIRYVALKSVRKKELSKKDREVRAFINDEQINEKFDKNLKNILWLTRLRTLIVDKKYEKALSYLEALPLSSMKSEIRRAFNGDGAEIVYGILNQYYNQNEFSKVIKNWKKYKDKYVSKVARDPYLNFIIGKTLIELGLFQSFESVVSSFKSKSKNPQKTFPIWVERKGDVTTDNMIFELQIVKNMKLKNWNATKKYIDKFQKKSNSQKTLFYRGIVAHENQNYTNAIKYFEKFLSSNQSPKLTNRETAELLNSYTDSVYEAKDLEKFQQVSKAILNDTKELAQENDFMLEVHERIRYLNIEILSGNDSDKDSLILENRVTKFLNDFPKTNYRSRLKYLLGVAYINNKKINEGKELFENLLGDEKVSETIKDMIRSDLSMLRIQQKTI